MDVEREVKTKSDGSPRSMTVDEMKAALRDFGVTEFDDAGDSEEDAGLLRHILSIELMEHGGSGETMAEALREIGEPSFREPAAVADGEIGSELRRLAEAIMSLGITFFSTDHLNDRELYTWLYEHCLPADACSGNMWDVLGGCSEDDIQTWLRFYAADEDRERHAREWNEPLPPKESPQYEREWLS